MIELPGNDRIFSLLTLYLDAQSKRAQVVATNVANADTPGYTAKELDFAEYLKQAAYETVSPRMAGGPGRLRTDSFSVVEQPGNPAGIDGNTVDVGREMATIADAGMKYLTGIQLLQSRMRTLRTAIREGR